MSSTRSLPVVLLTAALAVAGCSGQQSSAPSSAAPTLPAFTSASPTSTKPATPADPKATDYRPLLLTAADLTDQDDHFTQRSQEQNPNGTAGASAFFVNDKDDRAISDTFMIYPDAATATATLKQAAATLPTLVADGSPTPFPVGTDGVMVRGKHPDEAKDVTLLFFTEGPALVRLEFQSATGDATTDQFVTAVGKMQQVALRVGLAQGQ